MAREPSFRLPSNSERTFVMGRTGSGKTVFMVWLLSRQNIEDYPWIILDYKRDGYLASIPHSNEIKLGEIPRYPGVYRVVLDYQETEEDVNDYLFKILRKGRIGLFADEGKNIPQSEPRFKGLSAVFSQGRSLKVPVLFGTQRPSWINKSILSESEYFANLGLQNREDVKKAREFMPNVAENPIEEYHVHWYDVRQRANFTIRPVDEAQTFQLLDERLRPRRTFL